MEIIDAKAHAACKAAIQSVSDTLYVLSGKWKLPILVVLGTGSKRFGQMTKEIPNITERMLSKELRELEQNQLVTRTVFDSVPIVVKYSLTEYGHSLDKVIEELKIWGMEHRKRLMGN